jgi:hypothetical protein
VNRGDSWGLLYKCAVRKKAVGNIFYIIKVGNVETISWGKSVEAILHRGYTT